MRHHQDSPTRLRCRADWPHVRLGTRMQTHPHTRTRTNGRHHHDVVGRELPHLFNKGPVHKVGAADAEIDHIDADAGVRCVSLTAACPGESTRIGTQRFRWTYRLWMAKLNASRNQDVYETWAPHGAPQPRANDPPPRVMSLSWSILRAMPAAQQGNERTINARRHLTIGKHTVRMQLRVRREAEALAAAGDHAGHKGPVAKAVVQCLHAQGPWPHLACDPRELDGVAQGAHDHVARALQHARRRLSSRCARERSENVDERP